MSKVSWSARAKRAHARIYTFIAEHDPQAALRVGKRILNAGEALGKHPTGRKSQVPRTYEKSLTDIHYILHYRIERRASEDRIVILDIVHSRRNWLPGQLPKRG